MARGGGGGGGGGVSFSCFFLFVVNCIWMSLAL